MHKLHFTKIKNCDRIAKNRKEMKTMKKIALLLILALTLSLASCVATKIDEEKLDDVKTEVENVEETPDEPEMPELPWADGPVETPMIPPQFIEEDEVTEEDITAPAETPELPEAPADTDAPELDEKELPILQIVPEENETPAIPIE